MPHVAARTASRDRDTGRYQSHRPEQTLLYQIVDEYYPAFAALMAEQGKELPGYVQREFEEFLQCGRLEHGFLRVRCESCHAEHLVAFSCKRRGFCPSCGARRMAERAALLVDEVLPEQPMRQWVLSFPFQLRFLFGVVCGKGRNPTLRLWPAIFSGEIDVFPGDRRSRLISPGTADRKPGAAFGTKGVTGLRIRCCHLLTLLPDLVTIIYVRGEVLGKNWPKIAGDFRKVNITFRLDVYCRYM